jgi:hypothetical protein
MNHRSERINLIDGDEQERIESEEVLAIKGQSNYKIANSKTTKSVGSTQTEPIQASTGRSGMRCFNCDAYGHHHNQCQEERLEIFVLDVERKTTRQSHALNVRRETTAVAQREEPRLVTKIGSKF